MDKLVQKLKDLPKKPGVYEFKDKNGGVIYVGKAKNLRNRVAQYFTGRDEREQIPYLMKEAADLDYTVVNNELESLFLENTLIKRHLPKYNIILRDDKNYAFIKIDYSTEIPQIKVVRKIENNFQLPISNFQKNHKSQIQNFTPKSNLYPLPSTLHPKYFGPYSAAYKIRNTLNLIRKIFPFCSAEKVSSRPCFYYYLHRCPGVCVGKISIKEYKEKYLDKIADFLAGNNKKIISELKKEMKRAAKARRFEAAARLRDQIAALELVEEKQTVILPKAVDWDIVSLFSDHGYSCINLFKVRKGKLFDKENFIYEENISPQLPLKLRGEEKTIPPLKIRGDQGVILQTFLEQYYLETSDAPKAIYVQEPAEDAELIEHIIRSRFGHKAQVLVPQKGKPKELVALGQANAEEYLKNWLQGQAGHLDKINEALSRLKEALRLDKIPERIEGYDISNIQGTNAVGSMVVFEKGLPKKSEYRKFRIKSKQTPDDFAMMKEVFNRRFSRIDDKSQESIRQPADKNQKISKATWPKPDLIVVDGGKGQLSAALEVIQATSYKLPAIPTIGLAKRIEEIFVPGKNEPIILDKDDPALQLLQRLRDEAHRFGIAYHRDLRSRQAVKSALDDIPGIGPKTKKLLKEKFGTVKNIRKASLDELAAVVGEHIARLIQRSL